MDSKDVLDGSGCFVVLGNINNRFVVCLSTLQRSLPQETNHILSILNAPFQIKSAKKVQSAKQQTRLDQRQSSHPVDGRRIRVFSQAIWLFMFDLDLGALNVSRLPKNLFQFSDLSCYVQCICHSTNAEITAASLYAAIKTLQSRKAPKTGDKDEGK